MLGKSYFFSSLLRSWFASLLATDWIYPMDCVDLLPIILVNSGLGDGWAASALRTWEDLRLGGSSCLLSSP